MLFQHLFQDFFFFLINLCGGVRDSRVGNFKNCYFNVTLSWEEELTHYRFVVAWNDLSIYVLISINRKEKMIKRSGQGSIWIREVIWMLFSGLPLNSPYVPHLHLSDGTCLPKCSNLSSSKTLSISTRVPHTTIPCCVSVD